MGWLSLFANPDIPKWKIRKEDLIHYDFADYDNPICQNGLEAVKELMSSELMEDDVIVAGGFAACVAGLTDLYGDVDLFCINKPRLFAALFKRFKTRDDITITQELRREVGYCGSVTYAIEFTYKDVQFHLINLPKARNGFDIIKAMDLNWSMVYIDLKNDHIVAHPEAMSTSPKVNRRFIRPTTPDRMKKYAARLCREVDKSEFETLLKYVRVDRRAI